MYLYSFEKSNNFISELVNYVRFQIKINLPQKYRCSNLIILNKYFMNYENFVCVPSV